MKYFTSDWHLGHKNIVGPTVSTWKEGYRNFSSLEEMDATIIDTYNKYVTPGDEVYYLGDFNMGTETAWNRYMDRLTVPFYGYVPGNHDKRTPYSIIRRWEWFGEILETSIFGEKVVMSHYPMRSWNKSHHGSIHLYGHEHGEAEDEPWGKSMDVGVDNAYRLFGEWRPFSQVEILKIMYTRTKKTLGHHTGENRKNVSL